MTNFIHHDLIAEKLEIARTIGVVTDYLVNPTDPAHRAEAIIQVWRRPNAADAEVRRYLMHLLDGLVREHEIVVTATLGEALPELALGPEAVEEPFPAVAA